MFRTEAAQPRSQARLVRSAIRASALLLALAAPLRSADAQESSSPRYVRAKDTGAKVFNLADKSSVVLATAPAGSLLEVYGESAEFLSVDVPGGMPVWVYGQYLHATSVPGIVEVTGDGVFMRPLPKSDESSYPLRPQLHKGDRLRVIGRNDPTKSAGDDWVQVASPAGSRAWVVAADTTAVDAKEDVRAAWGEAVKKANAARPSFDLATGKAIEIAKTVPAAATSGESKADGDRNVSWAGAPNAAAKPMGGQDATLDAAEGAYEAARQNPGADWNAVRAAYQRFLDKTPEGPLAERARMQLQRVELHEEIQRIENDRSVMSSTRTERLEAAQRRLAEASRSQDPLWGRFQARGWVVREQPVAAVAPRFVVFWAGRPQAEIVCSSGRYDLSKFTDFEVGITGAVLREAVLGSESAGARPGRIDVTRIEVLGARNAR